MKFIFSQLAFFLAQQSNKKNMRLLARFTVFVLALIVLYSGLFHWIMALEGRQFSLLTGLYWTLTVMSTLGFGDITFNSDLGRVFSIVVLLSGIVLFMLVLPFTFIRFVYSPWLEAQSKALMPREIPEHTRGHVIIVSDGGIALSVVDRLRKYAMPCFLLMREGPAAAELLDKGYPVVSGDLDSAVTYKRMQVHKAALVVALHGDMKNTNIAATVREAAPKTPIAASADQVESLDILRLAGCTHVYHFTRMLGRTLARRVFGPESTSNIIGRFDELCIAETPAVASPYVGQALRDTDLRSRFGLNVVGIWQGKKYFPALPDMRIGAHDVLLLAGTSDLLEFYDNSIHEDRQQETIPPVLILGGGRVGKAVAADLAERRIPFRVVEQDPGNIPRDNGNFIAGNAADFETLSRAGIADTNTVIVTTHDDDLNIYLTIYCHKLRPDIQVISRATLDRNVPSLYNAGASLVMSHATMAANTIVNQLSPGKVFLLTEGLNIFRSAVPKSLVGVTLRDSNIRSATQCNVVAIRSDSGLVVNPSPDRPFKEDDRLILIGSVEAEQKFVVTYRATA